MPLLNPPGAGSPYTGTTVARQQSTAQNLPGTPPAPPQSAGPTSTLGNILVLDNGWYVLIGCVAGIMFSGTRVAPLVTGILGVALIFQLNLLIKHQ